MASPAAASNKADLVLAQDQRRRGAERDAQTYKQQRDQLQRASDAFDLAYPAVMRNLLVGKRIAVLFVGHQDGGIRQSVEQR